MKTYFDKAIAELTHGGMAKLCRVAPPNVTRWSKTGRVPVDPTNHVLTICNALNWRVTPHQLRPDIYPYPFDAVPIDKRK